ncbi:hypothetical protein ILYODFUR_005665 [Ilyodon furcidens]|uniref:Uncharacterized protein n=1 Tax=Ilyodon furcidens TaxID=33524 RepID=A0ABV0TS88_9TELE
MSGKRCRRFLVFLHQLSQQLKKGGGADINRWEYESKGEKDEEEEDQRKTNISELDALLLLPLILNDETLCCSVSPEI